MELKGELFLILLLSAALLAVSVPYYASLAEAPEEVFFGEGVFMLSQASSAHPLTEDLVADLREQPWVSGVSPEIYAFLSINSRPVVARGVEVTAFLRVEEGAEPELEFGDRFLLVGMRLAAEMGLGPGDLLLIPGSFRSVILEARVDDLLDVEGAPGDEMILDLPRARTLTGMIAGQYHMVRVRATDGQKLLEFLASSGANVLVGDGVDNVQVEDGAVKDDRIGALLLTNPDLAREFGRSYINSLAKYSGNSLQVVVLGMQILTFVLFLLILASSLVRFLMENRRAIGLVVAIGGTFPSLISIYGGRILALGLGAGLSGVLLGAGLGVLMESSSVFTFLGHVLRYDLDPMTGLYLFTIYAATLVLIVLVFLAFLLHQRPRDLLREVPEPSLREGQVVTE